MFLRNGTSEMLKFNAIRYLCLSLLTLVARHLALTKAMAGIIWGMINPFLPPISESLMNGPRSGKNALIMSLLEKTAVTSTPRIPPFGYPTVSS